MPTVIYKLSRFINAPSMREIISEGETRVVDLEGIEVRAVFHKRGGHRIHISASAFGDWIGPRRPGPVEFRSHISIWWEKPNQPPR